MKNEITINIIGPLKTGKSSIGKLISELLGACDIETSLNQVDGEPTVSTERAKEVVSMLGKGGLKVTINEVITFEKINLNKGETK